MDAVTFNMVRSFIPGTPSPGFFSPSARQRVGSKLFALNETGSGVLCTPAIGADLDIGQWLSHIGHGILHLLGNGQRPAPFLVPGILRVIGRFQAPAEPMPKALHIS